ncbi:MAG: aromatic ring-hydroxylating dioxygenase subunit alpha [Acidobacteria bacterium]|nr:aromatic ring-hydroxylating dioxygenase subunit alpha [Acidobacteriota bacterium]
MGSETKASQNGPAVAAPQAPSGGAIECDWCLDFWYPAVRSNRVRTGKLQAAMLLGIPLAVGRDNQGRVFAVRDSCPHRGMPFTEGWYDGELIECSYHGWKFDGHTGRCREIPSLTADQDLDVEKIRAKSFPAEEHDGYVWVYMAHPGSREERRPAPQLPKFSNGYRSIQLEAHLPCSIDHGIIGLMDPAHGPFVHQSWWWRGRRSIHEKRKIFEPIPNGFRMKAHSPSANSAPYKLLSVYGKPITTTIEFELPNIRREEIRCGDYWFSSQTTVTPESPERCRIDFVAAWNLFRWVPFLTPVLRWFGNRFIGQDQRTMEKQAEGLKYDPSLMLIDDADRPAKWYFQLKKGYIESKRNGAPMPHPMDGPATLRWRS